MTGSATLAMETALVNILKPDQTLLSIVHGYWGQRVASMGYRLGIQTHTLQTSVLGQVFSLEQIELALKQYRPRLMYICHGDSSVCTLQPLAGIGILCHKYNCLLMVDAVVSLCSNELAMDQLQIDVLFSGVQKALSGPPGLALISFSEQAVQAIKCRSKLGPASSFYMDIELVAKSWGLEKPNVYTYHYTPAVNLMYGLKASIQLIKDEGIENVIQRHITVQKYFEQRLEAIGLKCLVEEPKNRLAGITSVLIPKHINGMQVIKFMYDKYDILISGSLFSADDKLRPKFWRIGYLGVNAQKANIDRVINALQEAIRAQLKAHF